MGELSKVVVPESVLEKRKREEEWALARKQALVVKEAWFADEVYEAWFADEVKVRKTVGLLPEPVVQFGDSLELMCGICFEAFPRSKLKSAACGHPYCFECWEGYIRSSINDGPGCLMLRFPDPSCCAAIGQDMIHMFACEEDKRKYSIYLLKSFVEDNKKTKWCPAPGCEHAVNYVGDNENYDVSCLCSYDFCWNCTEETHRPVECNTVRLWILKNSAESENMNGILANSKPCPKCKRPIEKNQGCMHMTCSPACKFEFYCFILRSSFNKSSWIMECYTCSSSMPPSCLQDLSPRRQALLILFAIFVYNIVE